MPSWRDSAREERKKVRPRAFAAAHNPARREHAGRKGSPPEASLEREASMPEVTLQSCVPVRVYATTEVPPPDVTIDVQSTGSPTDGVVQVKPGSALPPVSTVPCGMLKPVAVPVPGPVEVWLHYQKSGSGPDEIDVTYSVY
jgi:hypothetical protein